MFKFIHTHGWYNIIKEIIIPLFGIATTMTIGIIIALLLKRKEEQAKIKSLLIDSYMLYLNKKVNFFTCELQNFTIQVFEDIMSNYKDYFDSSKNYGTKDIISKRLDDFKLKRNDIKQEEINWSPFTFRFCFLLGKKLYNKEAQKLENNIVTNYLSNKSRMEYFSRIKSIIISNVEIAKGMNSLESTQIDVALDKIQSLIADSYNEFQYKILNPYDSKIADLIEAY